MQTNWLLAGYALLCIAASLAGGWVPLVVHLTHRGMQFAISFVSGIVLGIGLLHLLPHSVAAIGSVDRAVVWVLAGFLFMFFLERFFHFHHHDAPEEDHPHDRAGCGAARARSTFPWIGVVVGLTLHALVDGVAIAAAVQAEAGRATLAGIGACMAVALHKPFDALTIGTLMAAAGRDFRWRQLLNAGYSLVTPLGIALFSSLSTGAGEHAVMVGPALGFAAGAFLCIASSDLLPELQFHRHDRLALSLALAAGLALAWSTVFLESSGHNHLETPAEAAEMHDHDQAHDHDGN